MKWITIIFCISVVQICSSGKSLDQISARLKALNNVNPKAVDDLIFLFKKFIPSADRSGIEMIVCSATLYTIAVKDDFYKTNRNISELYQEYSKAATESKLIQETYITTWDDLHNQIKSLLEKKLTPLQIDRALIIYNYILLFDLSGGVTTRKVDLIVSIYHNALGIPKSVACNIDFSEDFCRKYETCSRVKSVQKVCDILKARSDIDHTTVDELCSMSNKLKTFDEKDLEWMASFATLMTISLNGDFSKTNRNVSDIWQSVTGGIAKGQVSSEKEFMRRLKEMLSTELSLSKTEEALQFASTIYRHGRIDDRKEADYVISMFHNPLGLTKGTVCRIVFTDECGDNCINV
ncbi:uncharacterized protein LOC116346673 [Contarinia nasturtii]|uniref:uncharacterized protein LOC116346673 n=1 Tax=Contarinia nasturtii TaxID=265458 RepID=UPI0012D3AD91|nr:uncharacterized protein LOC116346673 [Contarinia nasturtii]